MGIGEPKMPTPQEWAGITKDLNDSRKAQEDKLLSEGGEKMPDGRVSLSDDQLETERLVNEMRDGFGGYEYLEFTKPDRAAEAKKLIEQFGLQPGQDITIKFSGDGAREHWGVFRQKEVEGKLLGFGNTTSVDKAYVAIEKKGKLNKFDICDIESIVKAESIEKAA